jgi:Flp pilus assembly protein TadG
MKRLLRITGKKRTTGQGLVEFALILPILLLLVCGIVDFGWMVFNYSQLYNGLREGLRYGSVTGYSGTAQYKQCDNIRKRIMEQANMSGVKASDITITYDNGDPATGIGTCPAGGSVSITGSRAADPCPPTDFCNGDRVVVDVNVNVQFLTPFMRPFLPAGMNFQLKASRTIYPSGLAG